MTQLRSKGRLSNTSNLKFHTGFGWLLGRLALTRNIWGFCLPVRISASFHLLFERFHPEALNPHRSLVTVDC